MIVLAQRLPQRTREVLNNFVHKVSPVSHRPEEPEPLDEEELFATAIMASILGLGLVEIQESAGCRRPGVSEYRKVPLGRLEAHFSGAMLIRRERSFRNAFYALVWKSLPVFRIAQRH